MEIIKLDTAHSTNSWLTRNEQHIKGDCLVYCHNQTSGRGQRGNSWESEPGKNITASVLFRPKDFPAPWQFAISEAIALAIVDTLSIFGVDAKVKWPNDIYVGDKKICGILIEHSIVGSNISRTVAGFGINVNQEKFLSNAPNPVSLYNLTGQHYDLEEIIEKLTEKIDFSLHRLWEESPENIHKRFLCELWRKDGCMHPFFDRLKKEKILAEIHDVAPDGFLTLLTENGEKRRYAFKEVEYLLKETDGE